MLLTVLMLGLAIACAAIGIWAMRRPEPTGAGDDMAADATDSVPVLETVSAAQAPRQVPAKPADSRQDAHMTRPSDLGQGAAGSIAFLDFDGAMGRIHIARPEIVIGRHSKDDVRINDVRVSRHHAKLVAKRGGGFEIHNLTADRSEPNPMQINGESREHADIADGDVVTLGGVSFVFRKAA